MNLNNEEFQKRVIDGKEECIVDFYADWCGPCQMMMPVMEEIAKEHTVYKINVDDENELALSFGIMSIPCIISFKDGKEYKKQVGMCSKSEIEDLLK
ncbi:MAG: thioredoxin [Bacilli bacterium]|nr:thioredoxin [Bacilli bacterium]